MSRITEKIKKKMAEKGYTDIYIDGYSHPVCMEKSGVEGGWAILYDNGKTILGMNSKELFEKIREIKPNKKL